MKQIMLIQNIALLSSSIASLDHKNRLWLKFEKLVNDIQSIWAQIITIHCISSIESEDS